MSRDQSGYTTPERAAATASNLREAVAARLEVQAQRLAAVAERLRKGGMPPTEARFGDPDPLHDPGESLPDAEAIRDALHAYDLAAKRSGPCVAVALEHAVLAKSVLGHHWEDTVVEGMAVEWKAGIEGGEWHRRYGTGRVMGVYRGEAALGDVTMWNRGCGSSGGSGIQVVSVADLRAERPD